jgi:hypothetical protein
LSGNPNKHVFVFTPSVGVEHFWMGLNRRHVFAPGVVHMCVWSVCDLDFKSMTDFS